MTKKNKLKIKLTYVDWLKITFKLFMGLGTLEIILYFWISHLVKLNVHQTPNGGTNKTYYNYYQSNGNIYSAYVFSYFTIQTNLFCLFTWITAGILHKYEGKVFWLKDNWVKAIAIYIFTTGVIYCGVLLPLSQPNTPYLWFQEMWFHAFVPITFLLYYLFIYNGHNNHQKYKKFYSKNVPLIIIYYISYLVFAITRGYLILINWKTTTGEAWSNKKWKAFNYFFLDVSGNFFGIPGYVWTIMAFFIILGFIFGVGSLLTFGNNKMYIKKMNKQKLALKNKLN